MSAVSFASPAMAATPLSHSHPIRIISVHLLDAAGRLLRVLFLDHQAARLATSKWPHLSSAALRAPRRGLILASNQQRVLGPQARLQVL